MTTLEQFQQLYDEKLAPLFDQLPEREADVLYLWGIQKKRVEDIATIFEVSETEMTLCIDSGVQHLRDLVTPVYRPSRWEVLMRNDDD